MSQAKVTQVTQLLLAWNAGNRQALGELTPLIYEHLRRLAHAQVRGERKGHSFQSTDLVHEVYLRLVDQDCVSWRDRVHFYGAAVQIMRRVLIDLARARLSTKRGGNCMRLSLDEALGVSDRSLDLLDIHECLIQLSAMDERQGRIVELRFFGGLSIEETAEAIGVSPITVKREWAVARAWLARQLASRRVDGQGAVAAH